MKVLQGNLTVQGRKYQLVYTNTSDYELVGLMSELSLHKANNNLSFLPVYESLYIKDKNQELFYNEDEVTKVRSVLGLIDTATILKQDLEVTETGTFRLKFHKGDAYRNVDIYETIENDKLTSIKISDNKQSIHINISKISYVDNVRLILPRPIEAGNSFYKRNLIETRGGKYEKLLASNAEYYTLDQLKVIYDLDHLDDKETHTIQSDEEYEIYLNKVLDSPGEFIVIDYETTGTDIEYLGESVITAVILSHSNSTGYLFPRRQEKSSWNMTHEQLYDLVNAVNNHSKKVAAQFATFEISITKKELGIDLRVDWDTYLTETVLYPGGISQYNLKDMAYNLTGNIFLELDMIFTGDIKFGTLPMDLAEAYAAPDGYNVYALIERQQKELEERKGHNTFQIEHDCMYATQMQKFRGLPVDIKYYTELLESLQTSMKLLEDYLFKKYELNINKDAQKISLLHNVFEFPIIAFTATGQIKTDSDTIQRLINRTALQGEEIRSNTAELFPDDVWELIQYTKHIDAYKHPDVAVLQTHAKIKKDVGTVNRILKNSTKGYFAFTLFQNLTNTGRHTSNSHQFTKLHKGGFVPGHPNRTFAICDYSQIELRVMAYYYNIQSLFENMKVKGADMHRVFLSRIYNIPMSEITYQMRQSGKAVNFGVVYLIGALSLASWGSLDPTKEDIEKATKALLDFNKTFPQLSRGIEKNVKKLKRDGFISTTLGRRGYFPEINNPLLTPGEINRIIRAAMNLPIQGFAADIHKIALGNIFKYIKAKGWDKVIKYDNGYEAEMCRIVQNTHDEIIVEFDHTLIPRRQILIMLKKCMEMELNGIPLFANPALVRSWADADDDIPTELRDRLITMTDEEVDELLNESNYLKTIFEFHKETLDVYISEVREACNSDNINEIAKHINHPTHTHSLIESMLNKKEIQRLSHFECKVLAVQRFLEKEEKTIKVTKDKEVNPFEPQEQYEVNEANEAKLITPDSLLKEEETEQVLESIYSFGTIKNIDMRYFLTPYECIIIRENLTEEEQNVVLNSIAKVSNPNKSYDVRIMQSLASPIFEATKFKVEYADLKSIFKTGGDK